MRDVEPDLLQVLEVVVPQLCNHSLWLLSEPGKGKTPLGRIIAMMFSRYHGGDGRFRSTCDLDFFRGVQFNKATPALYDDGDIGNETVTKKKAFADVADDEAMTRETWTTMLSLSAISCALSWTIAYNPEAEPQPESDFLDKEKTILHEAFYSMIRPALGNIAVTDAMAILKRSVFIIFSKKFVYYRLPSQQSAPVERLPWKKLDILQDSSKPILKNFLHGGPRPDTCDMHAVWEQDTWLHFTVAILKKSLYTNVMQFLSVTILVHTSVFHSYIN